MIVILTRRGQLWRKVQASQAALGTNDHLVMAVLPFEVVPVSEPDRVIPYARESTHLMWVPRFVSMRKEDEVRWGAYVNAAGVEQCYRFVVNGKDAYQTGFRGAAYWVTERE